jgi:hypothetical protein
MRSYIEFLIILPLLVVCYQLYFFSVHSTGRKQQDRCQKLGIAFMTLGIMALILKSIPTVFFGFTMMMFGFRLIAKGLDRLDKKIFIDKFEDDK